MYCLTKKFHPEIFQGKNKKKNYFEGWYYKLIDEKGEHAFAIIPGISLGEWDCHAFIQVLDTDNKSYYFKYDICDFEYNENQFEIMIGNNYFSKSRIRINLIGHGLNIHGDLYFNNIMEFPKSILQPSIMGVFTYLPMECYHEVISIKHTITGHLTIDNQPVDFSRGSGYIEKNWGRSLPESWIWFQSNNFEPDDVTVMFSVAKADCICKGFVGFVAFFRYNDRIFLFTTYNGGRIRKLFYNNNHLRVTVRDMRFRLDMSVSHSNGGDIRGAKNGMMNRDINETINAVVKVRFSDRNGNILYEGIGTNAGLEIME